MAKNVLEKVFSFSGCELPAAFEMAINPRGGHGRTVHWRLKCDNESLLKTFSKSRSNGFIAKVTGIWTARAFELTRWTTHTHLILSQIPISSRPDLFSSCAHVCVQVCAWTCTGELADSLFCQTLGMCVWLAFSNESVQKNNLKKRVFRWTFCLKRIVQFSFWLQEEYFAVYF